MSISKTEEVGLKDKYGRTPRFPASQSFRIEIDWEILSSICERRIW